jgi:hypothetical protein
LWASKSALIENKTKSIANCEQKYGVSHQKPFSGPPVSNVDQVDTTGRNLTAAQVTDLDISRLTAGQQHRCERHPDNSDHFSP